MFLSSFVFIFLAEIADKTQFLMLTLSRRYSFRSVMTGMILACLLLNLLSLCAASWLSAYVSLFDIRLIGGVLFLFFGFQALKPNDSQAEKGRKLRLPWLSVALAFFIAELGDKTQLSTIALTAQSSEKAAVFCGSFLGLLASNALAVTLGRCFLSRISDSLLRIFSAAVFFGFGSWTLFQLYAPSQGQIVLYCLLLFTLAYFYSLWQQRRMRS